MLKIPARALHAECGRKFVDTAELCSSDVQRILWTGLDLKAHARAGTSLGRPLRGRRVAVLLRGGCGSLVVQAAVRGLGADLNMTLNDYWEHSRFKKDVGRFYSLYSDLIIARGRGHNNVCELAEGATVPVLSLRTHKHAPLHALGVLMTVQERFGRLAGLTVGWVGPMGGHLNTLILLLPKVGVHLKFNSEPRPRFPSSPIVLPEGRAFCQTYNTRITECQDPAETITDVDVVITARHGYETIRIDDQIMARAKPHWAFLHLLPRWRDDVTEEVFQHKNSLVWTLHENMQYTIMACVLHALKQYNPVTDMPNFG